MTTAARADAADLARTFAEVSNWGRWGDDDQLGALNLITAERVAAAFRLATRGEVVSLGREIVTGPDPSSPMPVQHFMVKAGDCLDDSPIGLQESQDFVGMNCHGMGITHVDALCHMFVDGRMYNGVPASEVRSTGATRNAIAAPAERGIVGRGVLLDLPFVRGVERIDPGTAVEADELEAAAAAEAVTVGPGDILLVAHGRGEGPLSDGLAGLHPNCLPWLRERDVAVLGGDGIQDPLPPNGEAGWPFPVHQIGIAAMGLHLVDNVDLGPLSAACRRLGVFEFLFAMSPLRVPGATGCAVNPVAML